MSRLQLTFITAFSTALTLLGCMQLPPRADSERYFDSAMDDHNRAPSSLRPPENAGDLEKRIDSVSVQSKADYHYSLAESFSLDGEYQKSIESFRTTLIYDPTSVQVHLRLAAEYLRTNSMTEALSTAQAAEKINPKNTDVLMLIGGLYSTIKEYKKAIEQYQKILSIDPKNTEAPLYLGAISAEIKKPEQAIRYFEQLTKNEDYQTPYLAWYYIGRVHADGDKPAGLRTAEKDLLKALSLKPNHSDSVAALGQVYGKLKQPKKALDLYKKFQKEHGPQDKIAEILAQHYLEQEDYENALEQFEIVEKSSDDTLGVRVRIALILIELKRFTQAADRLQDVLRQVPESDKIRFYLGAVFEELNKNDQAVEQYIQIGKDSTFYSEAVVHAAYLLKTAKKVDQALAVIEPALDSKKQTAQFYSISASLWDEKGDLKLAEARVSQGLLRFPDSIPLAFYLGTLFDRQGDKKSVIEQMKKVIVMDPNHTQALNYLAFTYAETLQNLDEAEELAQRALVLEPKDGFVLDTLGWVLFRKGRVVEAIRYLEKAQAIQPTESVIAEHLADAYFNHQLFEKAKIMYEASMERNEDKKKINELRQKYLASENQRRLKSPEAHRQPASIQAPSPESQPKRDK